MSTSSTGRTTSPEVIYRTTKSGRKLRYSLGVIQQPERARACGSGAKSSADRRPIDPPPVVQLKIFDDTDGGKEITFQYSANFFLFATLEVARQIAPGRVQPTAPQIPVLTGMPVSGMAYLDRPHEAGYFIFPDLSVRHEGRYKLSFNLYEETKKDDDCDTESLIEASNRKMSNAGHMADPSFDWRMEIKSLPFTVYSAKKFPGLTESTDLSRTVAEQGCRVRIRRDVRMRRRETKAGADFDEPEDEYIRPGRALSPPLGGSSDYLRQRSASLSSSEDQQLQRRESGEFPPYNVSPDQSVPNTPAPPGGHLGFGHSQASQFAHPSLLPPSAPQSYTPVHSAYQNPTPPFRQQGPPPPPPLAAPAAYGYTERQHFTQFRPSNPPANDLREYETDYRRASIGFSAPPPQPIAPVTHSSPPYNQPLESTYQRNPSISAYPGYSRQDSVSLAPLRVEYSADTKFGGAPSPLAPISSVSRLAPSMSSMPNNYENPRERHGSYNQYPHPDAPLEAEAPRSGKRGFGAAFKDVQEPLRNGQRPSIAPVEADPEPDDELRKLFMSYKRADGTIRAAPQ